jgi:hypothetical protein
MKSIEINKINYISFDDTDWNTRALGCKTNEIYNIEFQTIENGKELLNKF